MKYLLIIFMLQGGVSFDVETILLESAAACDQAKSAINEMVGHIQAVAMCFPAGEPFEPNPQWRIVPHEAERSEE